MSRVSAALWVALALCALPLAAQSATNTDSNVRKDEYKAAVDRADAQR